MLIANFWLFMNRVNNGLIEIYKLIGWSRWNALSAIAVTERSFNGSSRRFARERVGGTSSRTVIRTASRVSGKYIVFLAAEFFQKMLLHFILPNEDEENDYALQAIR